MSDGRCSESSHTSTAWLRACLALMGVRKQACLVAFAVILQHGQPAWLLEKGWTGREASPSLSFPILAAMKLRVLGMFPHWGDMGVGTPKAPRSHLLPNPGVQRDPER